MLLNGILYNSEAWQNISEEEMKMLEDVDNYFLRKLLQAQSKTSISFLHLETGTLPIRFILANRRLVYFHNILSRERTELIHRVFKAQEENPTKGTWFKSVKKDFHLIKEDINDYDEKVIKNMKKKVFKTMVKKKIWKAAFEHLQNIQTTQSKINNIDYKKLSPQEYLTSRLFSNEEAYLLSKLRSKTTPVKENYKHLYSNTLCSLGCNTSESQEHLLVCKPLIERSNCGPLLNRVKYDDIFGKLESQKMSVLIFTELLRVKEETSE